MNKGTTVEIIADSINIYDNRLTTFKLRYPRMVHADFMTHRVNSRNASSSRAIPVAKLREVSISEMYVPMFRENKSGMQPGDFLTFEKQAQAEVVWKRMAEACAKGVAELAELGVHKQWANRPLEWFGYINVVVTATNWTNFLALRTDLDEYNRPVAQDEIYDFAIEMYNQLQKHKPKLLLSGEWHLPFITDEEHENYEIEMLLKMSAARCARVSYLTHDFKPPSLEKDLETYNRLVGFPIHSTPLEHQAKPDLKIGYEDNGMYNPHWEHEDLHGNFEGWIQHRKLVPNEFIREYEQLKQ